MKKAQKNAKKNITSDTINKVNPKRKLFFTGQYDALNMFLQQLHRETKNIKNQIIIEILVYSIPP